MKKIILLLIITASVAMQSHAQVPGACGKNSNPVPNNGSTTLGMTFNQTSCGLNYVHVDKLIETRYDSVSTAGNFGSGLPTTLSVSGIPASATIIKAYIWYFVSYLSSPQTSGVDLTNPLSATTSFPAVNIGQDQSKCWGEVGTVNYRADVTSAITGNGNYGLNITGISGTNGGNFKNWYDQIDGATLFIIYKDNSATYQGSLTIWDGDMTGVGNAFTQTMTGINACSNSSYANAFNIVSDFQDNVNAGQHPCTLNGATSNYPSKMWNFDIANTSVTSGQTTAAFGTNGQGSDCFDWGVMGLYYQTTNCVICTQCTTTTAIIDSVINLAACTSNNGAIYLSDSTTAGPLTYNWSNGATTQDVIGLSAGSYTVAITDTTGCITYLYANVSSPANLNIYFDTITTVPCNGTNGEIDVLVSGGTAPYTYSWSNGSTMQNATGLAYGMYSLTVTDSNGCSITSSASVQAPPNLPSPAICMVTVDSISKNNVIMWDKTSLAFADSFFIYREIGTNNYQLIGSVPYASLSMFIDTVRTKYFPNSGDPNAGTYRYKIAFNDSCGNKSVLSPYHNTIYVMNNSGAFSWSQLYTIENSANPVISYILMRDDNSTGAWHAINSVSGTQQTVIDPNYLTYQSTGSWRVETQWNISCNPTIQNSNPMKSFSSSRSNIYSLVSSVHETDLNNYFSVYPNPTNGEFTIYNSLANNNYELKITNVLGEVVFQKNVNRKQETVNLNATNGVYFLNVKTANGTAVKKIVKN